MASSLSAASPVTLPTYWPTQDIRVSQTVFIDEVDRLVDDVKATREKIAECEKGLWGKGTFPNKEELLRLSASLEGKKVTLWQSKIEVPHVETVLVPFMQKIQVLEIEIEDACRRVKAFLDSLTGLAQTKRNDWKEFQKDFSKLVNSWEPLPILTQKIQDIWTSISQVPVDLANAQAARYDRNVKVALLSLHQKVNNKIIISTGPESAGVSLTFPPLFDTIKQTLPKMSGALTVEDSEMFSFGGGQELTGALFWTHGYKVWSPGVEYKELFEVADSLGCVARAIVRLKDLVTKRLLDIAAGKLLVRETPQVIKDILDDYQKYIKGCEERINSSFEKISTFPATDRTSEILQYATCLEYYLDEVKRCTEWLISMNDEQRELALAQHAFYQQLELSKGEFSPFFAAEKLRAFVYLFPKATEEPIPQITFPRGFEARTVAMLYGTIANHGPKSLILTPLESDVWSTVMRGDDLTFLRQEDDIALDLLPLAVRNYIEKVTTKLLYFKTAENNDVVEFEVFLYALEERYKGLFEATQARKPGFGEICKSYDTSFVRSQHQISSDLLERATLVCEMLEKAHEKVRKELPGAFHCYAEGWQRFVELKAASTVSAEPVALRIHLLDFVYSKLRAVSADYTYILPFEDGASLELGAFGHMSTETIKRILDEASFEKRQALLFRALTCMIYGKELQFDPRSEVEAAEMLLAAYFPPISDHFDAILHSTEWESVEHYTPLLYECLLQQLIKNSPRISDGALKLFIEDTIKSFIQNKATDDLRVVFAITRILIKELLLDDEKQVVTPLAKGSWGEKQVQQLIQAAILYHPAEGPRAASVAAMEE